MACILHSDVLTAAWLCMGALQPSPEVSASDDAYVHVDHCRAVESANVANVDVSFGGAIRYVWVPRLYFLRVFDCDAL
jgi:hypothetical protein